MPNVLVIVALVSAALGFGAAWKIQNGLQAESEKEYAESQLENQRLATKALTRQYNAVVAAQDSAKIRDRSLRMDADAARSALIGLSHATDAALRDAATSQAACLVRATTLSELFIASTAEYSEVAAKAGRHANDVQTLSDAWPK